MHIFVHLSSISRENFKDHALIIPEILELIKLHTYKFGLVYVTPYRIFLIIHVFTSDLVISYTDKLLVFRWVQIVLLL